MGEAIITARIGDSVVRTRWKYITKIVTANEVWEVPEIDTSKGVSVRIFGGGAGGLRTNSGYGMHGGSSGWMNNAIFTNLNIGDKIPIIIGTGGVGYIGYTTDISGHVGGTSSFGKYLSANGGSFSGGGAGGGALSSNNAGIGYQFGGGGTHNGSGGDGGYWGGGGSTGLVDHLTKYAGNGGYYGGGGAGNGIIESAYAFGGNGGYYGGGGYGGLGGLYEEKTGTRGGCIRSDPYNTQSAITGYSGLGGNGQYWNKAANGVDTSTWTNVFNDGNGYFRGKGLARGDAGGGFGGNGGSNKGGGGGYGSNGGNNYGGGGGFGGDGGDGSMYSGGGGGGGYGKTAKGGNYGGGGGGYYSKGGDNCGGGGGYGDGGSSNKDGGYAAGGGAGGSGNAGNGGGGICIIQYYGKVLEY